MKWFLTALLLLTMSSAHADRITEVEDYYTERTSKFIQSRFPSQAFTVIALVEVQKTAKKEKSENLPYLDVVDKDMDVWNKNDVPLSTLISFVDKVSIKVELESAMDDKEVQLLQSQLFDYLKLSTASDKIEIIKIPLRVTQFTSPNAPSPVSWWTWGGVALALLSLFFVFMQWSVRTLVKGLSQPLTDLNKSNQTLATHGLSSQDASAKNISWESTQGAPDSSYESRKMFKELFLESKKLFEQPSLELMDFLEEQGAQNPSAMSVVLAELDKDTLKTLYSYGTGDWWFYALAIPPQVTPQALDILFKIHKLKIKNDLSTSGPADVDLKDFVVTINRLNDEELGQLLKPLSYQQAASILYLLPKHKALRICKNVYPGSWAQFVDPLSPKGRVPAHMMKDLKKEATRLKPLREIQSVETFFNDIEIEKYLDLSSTWDEREYYKVLSPDSRIKKGRTPFYTLFDIAKDDFSKIIQEVSLNEIALIYEDCEREECARFYENLTERQRFRLKEILNQKEKPKSSEDAKISVKKKVRALLSQLQAAQPKQEVSGESQAA